MERGTMLSAGAALQTPQEIPTAPMHPITWPLSCYSPVKPNTYQGSMLATSLTPGSDIWSAAHHQWKGQSNEENSTAGHDDSGISPGRASSSGPSSVGGSPPAAKTAEAGGTSSSMFPVKEEQPDKDQTSSLHEEDSSISSEENNDAYGASMSPNSLAVILRCPLCGSMDFDSLPALIDHCKNHPETNLSVSNLNCSLCSLASLSKETFLTHLITHLPQEHHCTVCGFSSKSLPKLNAHLAEFHGLAPADNNNETVTRVGGGHGKVKSFRCKQCSFVAHTKLEFWAHSKAHIKGDKILSCPRCPFVTEYKHHLEYHLRNHSGSKPFKCPQCPYTCVNKSMLNSHLKSHSNVYQYRCADCNYVTKYCHSLKLHLRKYMHSPAMVLNPDGSPNPLPIIDVYGTRRGPKVKKDNHEMPQSPAVPVASLKCAQCDFSTTSEGQYQQHLMTSHPVQQPINPLKEYLSWVYAQQVGLMQHLSANALNPLDLRKETPPPPPPPASPPAKNRRKGKVPFRLEEEEIQVDDEEDRQVVRQKEETVSAVPPNEREKEGVDRKMLNCGYCDIFFKDAVMYAMHMGYHGYKDPFHCNMCGEKTNDKLSFFLHIARSSHL